jgi:hypothetical protein
MPMRAYLFRYETLLNSRRDLIDIRVDIAAVNPAAADSVYNRIEARIGVEIC